MSNIKYRIPSKPLSEYLYRTLTNLTHQQRTKYFTEEELKMFESDAKLSDYCAKEQLDRVLLILTKIGKVWDLRIYDEKTNIRQLEFNTTHQFLYPEKRVDVTERMAEEDVLYLGAHDTMLAAMMSTMNINSPIYQLSHQAKRMADRMSNIKNLKVPYDEQIARSVIAYEDTNKLMLGILSNLHFSRGVLSQNQGGLRVLAALFTKRYTAMTFPEIAKLTRMTGKAAFLKRNVANLLKDKLIMTDKPAKKVHTNKGSRTKERVFYMLTTEGIRRIMEWNNMIHKNTFGDD
jgi:hypothetical protein